MQKRPLIFTFLAVFAYVALLSLASFLRTHRTTDAILKEALVSESRVAFSGMMDTALTSGSNHYKTQAQIWQSGGVKYIHKGKKTFSVPPVSRDEAEKICKRILRNYTVRLEQQSGKIAGRDTYVLVIKPKYAGNASKKLWVDRENYFILKKEDTDAAGNVIAESTYTSIAFLAPEKNAEPQARAIKAAYENETLESLSEKLKFKVKEPRKIPEGYAMEKCHLFICPDHCGMKAAQLVYSDGLNTFSVFEVSPEKSGCTKLSSCYKMCRLKNFPECLIYKSNPFATVVSLASTDPAYVFVGNLPKEMFLQMAEAIRKGAGGSVQGTGETHEH